MLTLHSFRCTHFACETGAITCIMILNNFAFHTSRALDVLCSRPIERRVSYPVRCPMCTGPIDIDKSRTDCFKARPLTPRKPH